MGNSDDDLDAYLDRLVNEWIPGPAPAPAPAPGPVPVDPARAPEPEPRTPDGTWIFQFGCGHGGGPWAYRLDVARADANGLLAGRNAVGDKSRLLRKASTRVDGSLYTFVAYGARGSNAPDAGEVDGAEFRKVLSRFRGSDSQGKECYVVRSGRAGAVDFDRADPFMQAFFPRFT